METSSRKTLGSQKFKSSALSISEEGPQDALLAGQQRTLKLATGKIPSRCARSLTNCGIFSCRALGLLLADVRIDIVLEAH
jgi:hypothetical protein